jgi:hypothetical protein
VCVHQGPAGFEKGGIRTVAAARCSEYLNATSIDSFLRRTSFSHVFQLVVDTEGHDAAVLMGMRQSLRERRIRILQFEYSGRWPVEPKECKLRSLDAHYPVACKKPSRTLGSTVRALDVGGSRIRLLLHGRPRRRHDTDLECMLAAGA